METKESIKSVKTSEKIQLVKGEFTSVEASEVIITLLDQKINFHKIQRLQLWEEDHNCEMGKIDNRIQELQEEKKVVKEFLHGTKGFGKKIKINAILQMSLAD